MSNYKLGDHDRDSRPGVKTIGEALAGGGITEISDGEFNLTYLARYPQRSQLEECCRWAFEELADEPYHGRESCARVMGRAMELLREIYGCNAPRGWVPVMHRLRAAPTGEIGANTPSTVSRSRSQSVEEDPFRGRPEELLTRPPSVLQYIDRDGALCALAEQRPDIKAAMVELARKRGVPCCYDDGADFMDELVTKITPTPDLLLMVRSQLRERANEYIHLTRRHLKSEHHSEAII
jgi:hypothetical protein